MKSAAFALLSDSKNVILSHEVRTRNQLPRNNQTKNSRTISLETKFVIDVFIQYGYIPSIVQGRMITPIRT